MRVCVYFAVLALSCAALFGQATSQIQGVVQDATGSAVPGAEVKVTQTDTGAARSAVSDSAGAGGVTTIQNSAQFGQILNALDPRIMQVAAKFVF